MTKTFYWHDYETFGTQPGTDRIAQFAGIRTDEDLNPIDAPLIQYCKPADDFLPDPYACMVTGISPQLCLEKGLPEYQFIQNIHQQMAQANTCTVGYNNLRFDDEFTRFSFYRNFYDPYAREWANGNSRWDLIDVVRMTAALRPEGINWPIHEAEINNDIDDDVTKALKTEETRISFRLEKLTAANGISHQDAHDALSDVYATIALAKLIKEKQPKLFNYALELRNKHKVLEKINLANPKPFVHISGMIPGKYNHCSIVYPIMFDPSNKNAIIVFDCRYDPTILLDLTAEEIRHRLFLSSKKLAEQGLERIHLKTIHINKCPAIAPLSTLNETMAEKHQIKLTQHLQYAKMLKTIHGLTEKLALVFQPSYEHKNQDPDQALYSGGFFSPADKALMQKIVNNPDPQQLLKQSFPFKDQRLADLFFRYKGRNFHHLLDSDAKTMWENYRLERLKSSDSPSPMTLENYNKVLQELMPQESEDKQALLLQLQAYPSLIGL